MGHVIDYIVVSDKKDILATAEDFAFYNVDRGENPSGSYHGNMTIHTDRIHDSYEEAEKAINFLDNGWYDDHAVMFRDTRELSNAKTKAIDKRIERQIKEKETYIAKNSIQNRKSNLIGCVTCGSKLSREHLKTEKCPLCHTDLRSDTVINRLNKYNSDIRKLRQQKLIEQTKLNKSAKIKWLVKVEVHN